MLRALTVFIIVVTAGCADREPLDVGAHRVFLLQGKQKLEVDLRPIRGELKAAKWTPLPYSPKMPYEFQIEGGPVVLIDMNATYQVVGKSGHFVIPAMSGPNGFLYWKLVDGEVSAALQKRRMPNQSPQHNAGIGPAVLDSASPPRPAFSSEETAPPQSPRG